MIDTRQEFATLRAEKYQNREVRNIIFKEYMAAFKDNCLDVCRPAKAVIKDFFYKQLKNNGGNVADAILDCQICYEVSGSYIKKCIYQNKDIRI